jgi:hypothetical protein
VSVNNQHRELINAVHCHAADMSQDQTAVGEKERKLLFLFFSLPPVWS